MLIQFYTLQFQLIYKGLSSAKMVQDIIIWHLKMLVDNMTLFDVHQTDLPELAVYPSRRTATPNKCSV